MAKVSIITPIYGVEKYIEKSIISLMEQTFRDIEYIFVNDCTPDSSMEILERVIAGYPDRISQIKILNQACNQGSAAARAKGINSATGQYVIQIDSDDYCEVDMIEQLHNKAIKENADIVICDYYVNYVKKQIYVRQVAPSQSIECMKALLRGELHGSTWNKLISIKLYSENNINFVNGVNMWEDLSTVFRLCYFANRIAYLPMAFLHYMQINSTSYTACPSIQSLDNMRQAIAIMEDFLTINFQNSNFEKEICFQKLSAKCEWLKYTRGIKQRELCQFYPEANKYIMDNKSNPIYYRYAQLLASKNMFWVANLMLNIIHLIKNVIRK